MRVTNSMLVSNFMNNLNTNLNKLDKYQSQLARGRKYAYLKDDPVSVIYSLEARARLETLANYQTSVQQAQSWTTQAETSVRDLDSIIQSAYENLIGASTDAKSAEDRKNDAEYIGQLRDQILHTLNTTFGDKYLFAGYNTTGSYPSGSLVTPFTVDEATGDLIYNGLNLTTVANQAEQDAIDAAEGDMIQFWVGAGLKMDATVNGITLVGSGEENLYALLDTIYNAMLDEDTTAEDLQPFITKLQNEQNRILSITAELGGRTNRLDMLSSRYEQDYINYTQMKSDAEDADEAEVIMNYKMAEAVYKAALAAGSYIIQPTLMDFLS